MKKHLFTTAIILFAKILLGQSVPNGGFESWTITNYENPKYWQTSCFEKDEAVNPINAIKTTDSYHGQYAIKLITSAVATGTKLAFGWIANGQPGSPSAGGIPYSQKPTGLRFYYKSNIILGDTAIFVLMFRKAGVQIGAYLYKFATTQTAYTLFDNTFSPALSVTPDTMVVAAASSMAFNNLPYLVGNSIQLDSLTFKGVPSQPALFNGDFEQWIPTSNDKLNGWYMKGDYLRTTDVFSGTYALELQTAGPNLNHGSTISGTANTFPNGGGNAGGYPYSTQVDTAVFYYKYLPADPTDNARYFFDFKKNGAFVANINGLLGISASYKQVKIAYNLPQVPDSLNITFESSLYPTLNSYIGSDLKIDNLYLTSQKYPISNFNLPSFGCLGQQIQLTDNSANMANAWGWIMPGGSPGSSTAQNPMVTYFSAGTKTITMIANNQFGSGATISKTITIYPVPNVAVTSTVTPCGGSNVILTASGATTYTWSNGANTPTIAASPSVSTVYTVTGTSNGCINYDIANVIVPNVPTPDICMVTVDSLTKNNEIYWDKALYPMLDSMIIYRQVTTNVYKRIGAVKKTALSMFTDTARSVGPANGDPKISTYRYKIQVRDTCGSYGPKSKWHNTVYFTHTGSTFFWVSGYAIEGPINPVSTYSLMVCVNPTVSPTFTVVGTTAGNQFTLNDPNYAIYQTTADWRVEANLGYVCNPTQKLINPYGILDKATKSRSNIENNRVIGIKENSLKNGIKIYPNPSNGVLKIDFGTNKEDGDISLINVLGQSVYSDKMDKNNSLKSIDVSNVANGVYTLELSSKTQVARFKIVVEK